MVRKSLFVFLVIAVVLSISMVVMAQEYWQWNKFTGDNERFKYEITTYSPQWDYETGEDVLVETKQYQIMELRNVDDETTEVTMGYTYNLQKDELAEQLNFMGLALPFAMSGGEWMGEFMMLGLFATELELEVGNSMQTFDGSRIRVIDKQTVAGVEGYFWTKSRREEDADGNRVDILTSEWVVAPDVGWPLLVRMFQDDQVQYIMELVEYSRN